RTQTKRRTPMIIDSATEANRTSENAHHDFDHVVDRRNSNSMKWQAGAALLTPEQWAADPLPMWVADTYFAAPKAVTDDLNTDFTARKATTAALHSAVDHGVYGYPAGPTPSQFKAVAG